MVLVTLLLSCLAMLSVSSEYSEMLAPPPRPAEFKSATQLRQYLAALNEYYSIMGRPRFGKRGVYAKRASFSSKGAGEGYSDDGSSWNEFQ